MVRPQRHDVDHKDYDNDCRSEKKGIEDQIGFPNPGGFDKFDRGAADRFLTDEKGLTDFYL